MARPVPAGGLDAVEHVIVLMQENRSFDHYFGTMRGVRGYGDRVPLELPEGGTVFEQPGPGGSVLPFSLRQGAESEGRPVSDIQYLGDLDHSWAGSGKAWAGGWLDDWIAAKTAATMTYYERRDIPLQYELADTFTICDAYHCSVFGSTNPNRNYLWTGKVGYEPGTKQRAVTNAAYDHAHPGYDWTTYPERLEQAGVSWQIYQEWDNFTDNAVEYFKPFKAIGHKILAEVEGGYRTTEEFYTALFDKPEPERRKLLAQFESGRAKLTDAERRLFDRAMYRSEPETLVRRLRDDIASGGLPKVTWLVPSAVDSEHPGSSTPVGSANLVFDVLDAIASDPQVWSKTVLLLNFDENDGFFDHMPPPVPPESETEDWYDGQPIGLGPRVPMTVVSPWTIGGHVNSQVFDHTSVLRFLERWTGVEEPNISAWRRRTCGDLLSVFDFGTAGAARAGEAGRGPGTHRPLAPEAAGGAAASRAGAGKAARACAAVPARRVGLGGRREARPSAGQQRNVAGALRAVLLRRGVPHAQARRRPGRTRRGVAGGLRARGAGPEPVLVPARRFRGGQGRRCGRRIAAGRTYRWPGAGTAQRRTRRDHAAAAGPRLRTGREA
ncbi:phospholipase C [Saccharopolyspora erythraea NRRL 2338]|uniref:Non-hemolytic phospholipase C n=2 Tax=Saccharopolyspora erythraea TaxID=1836 RepID=A4FLN5_SACEN|nr:phospholipase C [Saccharopolyspora erythraea NRRL 2338]CAM04960.1 non-hemolytic phospholipase C precursor [Saccharopolyspora erythraea NRRL 2338]